jgi:alpha-galactosidase
MQSKGLKDLGYEYLLLDDCWMAEKRGEGSHLQADKAKFPNGIKSLVSKLSPGFKIGLTSSADEKSCSGSNKPGSLGYENLDAMDFGSWGIQHLRYEYCNDSGDNRKANSLKVMKDTVSQFSYDILFSIWAQDYSNLDPNLADYWMVSEKTFESFTSIEYNFRNRV